MAARQQQLILVVDDEPHIVQVLQLKLESAGFQVITAENGEEALDGVMKERPDLVITDLQMPLADGLDLMVALAATDFGHDIPCLLLTGKWAGQELERRKDLGNLRGVLTKPFSPHDLLMKVRQLLTFNHEAPAKAS